MPIGETRERSDVSNRLWFTRSHFPGPDSVDQAGKCFLNLLGVEQEVSARTACAFVSSELRAVAGLPDSLLRTSFPNRHPISHI